MQSLRAVRSAATKLCCALAAVSALVSATPASAAWDKPWTSESRALVVDAYEFNPIDWQALTADKRIAGFINKASDGLPPEWNCRAKSGDEELLCKNRWWKYSVTKELYMTRRAMAKTLGLKWGAYHLARPGNPRAQADHFLDFAEPAADDLIAIDIEDNTDEWMSLTDAEIFADQIKIRTGRYPVLYTNGSTAKWISDYKATYPLLSRLPLWYARYRDDITGMFPENTWPSYALWQFSSMHNCSAAKCPYRVKGAKTDIDVNVSPLDVAGLKAAWPFDELVTPPQTEAPSLVAEATEKAETALASLVGGIARLTDAAKIRTGSPTKAEIAEAAAKTPLLAAYGPAAGKPARIDPLQLITATARAEHDAAAAADQTADASKPVIRPGQARQIASLGAFSSMSDAMEEVALIVPRASDRVAVARAAMPAAFGPGEKSRVRRWLEASLADDDDRVPQPVGLSQLPFGQKIRGAWPSSETARAALFGPLPPNKRIDGAFQATR